MIAYIIRMFLLVEIILFNLHRNQEWLIPFKVYINFKAFSLTQFPIQVIKNQVDIPLFLSTFILLNLSVKGNRLNSSYLNISSIDFYFIFHLGN